MALTVCVSVAPKNLVQAKRPLEVPVAADVSARIRPALSGPRYVCSKNPTDKNIFLFLKTHAAERRGTIRPCRPRAPQKVGVGVGAGILGWGKGWCGVRVGVGAGIKVGVGDGTRVGLG